MPPSTDTRPPTKQERREAARLERKERELAEQAAERRKRRLGMLGGVAILALALVAVAIAISSAGDDGPGAAGGDDAVGGREAAALFGGIPQKGTTVGPPDAPVTVTEFADLQCPVCRVFATDVLPSIVNDYVRPGQVRLQLATRGFLGPDSGEAARVAAGAAQQNRLWQFVDTFYKNQGTENSGYVTGDFLRKVASAVPGLNVERALAFQDGGKSVADADALANRFASSSTPAFLIQRKGEPPRLFDGDFTQLGAEIEKALKG